MISKVQKYCVGAQYECTIIKRVKHITYLVLRQNPKYFTTISRLNFYEDYFKVVFYYIFFSFMFIFT